MNTTQTAHNITSASVRTDKQVKTYGPKFYRKHGQTFRITADVRYDDQCKNGHNTFSVTGTIDEKRGNGRWVDYAGGCIHEEIAKHFPKLAPFIKWHLCNADGPMYYVDNTLYHAKQNGPTHAWVYYIGAAPTDPLGMGDDSIRKRLLGYIERDKAVKAEGQIGYTVEWDDKTAKERNLDAARDSAVWPDATDADLTQPPEALKAALLTRLPALLAEFRTAVESLGFKW